MSAMDARIDAACDYMYDVYGDDERERMRGVLEAADAAEASDAETLARVLREIEGFSYCNEPACRNPICVKVRAALARRADQ